MSFGCFNPNHMQQGNCITHPLKFKVNCMVRIEERNLFTHLNRNSIQTKQLFMDYSPSEVESGSDCKDRI